MRYACFWWSPISHRNVRQLQGGRAIIAYAIDLAWKTTNKAIFFLHSQLYHIIFPFAFSTTPCLLVEMHPNLHHDKLGREVGSLYMVDLENEPSI